MCLADIETVDGHTIIMIHMDGFDGYDDNDKSIHAHGSNVKEVIEKIRKEIHDNEAIQENIL